MLVLTRPLPISPRRWLVEPARKLAGLCFALILIALLGAGLLLLLPIVLSGLFVVFSVAILAILIVAAASAISR